MKYETPLMDYNAKIMLLNKLIIKRDDKTLNLNKSELKDYAYLTEWYEVHHKCV